MVEKNKAKWLTFEYALAMVSVTLATVISSMLVGGLFGLWTTKASMLTAFTGGALVAHVLSVAILALLFAVLAKVLFSRVTRTVAEDRSGYTSRLAYKLTTYGALFVLVLVALPLVANLLSVLVSSLLLIGVSQAGSVYGGLYLGNFLPSLVALAIVGVVICLIAKIICGFNKSRLLGLVLIGITATITVALAITLAVQAHDRPTIKTRSSSSSIYFD